jgi:uncharacterized membrane protein
MRNRESQQSECQICHRKYSLSELLPATFVHGGTLELVKAKFPEWTENGYICFEDLNSFRSDYVEDALKQEQGELTSLDKEVLQSLDQNELISKDTDIEFAEKISFGNHLADRIASFGGSWKFIIIFAVILGGWIAMNTFFLSRKPFDPFPFILLNLILSCVAAIQAPVIMMSQNRQEQKDRFRAQNDYKVNLKAEIEIRNLNAKIDLLLTHQWQRLLEIQQIQMELMEEMTRKGK